MNEPERQRRRPAVSCTLCRRRKIRCNRETPCSNCLRSREATCFYQNRSPQNPSQKVPNEETFVRLAPAKISQEADNPVPSDWASGTSSRLSGLNYQATPMGASITGISPSIGLAPVWHVESMKARISELEEQLSKLAHGHHMRPPVLTTGSDIETTTSPISGTFHIHHETRLPGEARIISRSMTHKTRLFGQSHWVNGVAAAGDIIHIVKILESHDQEKVSHAFSTILRCKSLARIIKSQRTPPWPSPPSIDLPPKEVADKLVDHYIRTSETIYRVLHLPTFMGHYKALWDAESEPDAAFLVQLKLVLAIGAAIYDEQFSLRNSAIQWIYEGQTWISDPLFKSKLLNIRSLQINILVLLARERIGVGEEGNWIYAGALVRLAVYMGLHRDPTSLPKRSTFASEMRRRLWNTILEISVQSSITSGGPPLISLADFDAKPPGNFNDDQLMVDNPVPKSESDHTEVYVAIALRKTLPVRLIIAKTLNDLGSDGTYEETLRLDAEFRASFKILRRTLQGRDLGVRTSLPGFEIRAVELIMYRYLLALHIPFFGPSLCGVSYAFSRKVVIETSLKVWCAAYPSSSVMATQRGSDIIPLDQDDLTRLTICGSGLFSIITIQASLIVAGELKAQLQEEEGGLGPVPLRSDLLSILEEMKSQTLRRIQAGETNVKGHMVCCLLFSQIEGLRKGVGKEEFPGLLVKAVEDAGKTCLPILEAKVTQVSVDEPEHIPLDISSQLLGGWDFVTSEAQFNFGDMGPMNWLFNEEDNTQGSLG